MYYLIGPCTIFFLGPSRDCNTEDDIESEDFDISANFSSSIRSLGVVSTTPAKQLCSHKIGAAPAPLLVDGIDILFPSLQILIY